MKLCTIQTVCLAIYLIGSLIWMKDAKAYTRYEFKGGIGFNHGFNIGINSYYNSKANFGIGFGSIFPPGPNKHHFDLSFENYMHFPLKKFLQRTPALLLSQQVLLYRYSEPDFKHYAVTLMLNAGIRWHRDDGFGFLIEAGPAVNYTLSFEKVANSTITPITNTPFLNVRIMMFQLF